jgi:hypothetical protein
MEPTRGSETDRSVQLCRWIEVLGATAPSIKSRVRHCSMCLRRTFQKSSGGDTLLRGTIFSDRETGVGQKRRINDVADGGISAEQRAHAFWREMTQRIAPEICVALWGPRPSEKGGPALPGAFVVFDRIGCAERRPRTLKKPRRCGAKSWEDTSTLGRCEPVHRFRNN